MVASLAFLVSYLLSTTVYGEQKFCFWGRSSTDPNLANGQNWLNGIWEKAGTTWGWPYYRHIPPTGCYNSAGEGFYAFHGSGAPNDNIWMIGTVLVGDGDSLSGLFAYCADAYPQDFQWYECTDWRIGPGDSTFESVSTISITETDACPQIMCNQVYYYGGSVCDGTYDRMSATRNLYYSSTTTYYVWYNDYTSQWICGDGYTQNCGYGITNGGSIQYTTPAVWTQPALNEAWALYGISAGYMQCNTGIDSSPVPTTGSPYPSQAPIPDPTKSPNVASVPSVPTTDAPNTTPTDQPAVSPDTPTTATPSSGPNTSHTTKSPSKGPIPSPTRAPLAAGETAEPTEPTPEPTRSPLGVGETAEPTEQHSGEDGGDNAHTFDCNMCWLCLIIATYRLF